MSNASSQPPLNIARMLAAAALPWLLSSTSHVALLLALATYCEWTFRATPQGTSPRPGSGVNVTLVASDRSDDNGQSDTANLEAGPSAGRNDDVEPAPAAMSSEVTTGGDLLAGGSLASMLKIEPALGKSGVRQVSALGLGPGELPGRGTGSARGSNDESRGSNRLRGGYARTGVFGVEGEGRKFAYVFDRSGSMDLHGGAPLKAAKAELIASLVNLGPTHQFQIIFYNERPRVFNPSGSPGRLVFGTDQNKFLAEKFVGSITADGATRHEEALVMALRMAPDVIFFLTDADEPRMTAKDLARIERLNGGAIIHAIEFGYGRQNDSDNFLVKLARQNNGQHVYVDVSQLPRLRR